MTGIVRPDIRSMQTPLLEGMTMTATTSHTPNTSVNPIAGLAGAPGGAATATLPLRARPPQTSPPPPRP